ncbi:aldehyde dehydrogenase family protein [Rhodococcus opacus]|uniref:Aldehyde dehydrogenase n=1 Tax=Rhodococcus opacus (strain B4) TaxID=632772 RepID=C1B630_RHOOB|nr:aldehyde dehydrogenase family protein [Rhodococcus opacus]BAH55441.1 aldehyde dehydrogenase [Rhodococcus opacus B4]
MTTEVPSRTRIPVHPDAAEFLGRDHQLFINGEWTTPRDGGMSVSLDPGSGEQIATFAVGGKQDAHRAVAAAVAAFEPDAPWRVMSAASRARLLFALADLMEEHQEELAHIEALDSGKPLAVARDFDVAYAIRHVRYFAGWTNKIEGATIPVDVPDMMCRTERTPVGVAALIVPWNYPILIACWKLAPALAAGCTTVLKPAEQTSLSVLRLAELISDAGFPPGVVNILPGSGSELGPVLVEHPEVEKISFTGSTRVGEEIARRAATGIKRVTLELGGKSANIIFADANLDHAIEGAAAAIFSNTGQMCSAGSRLYVERPILDTVLARLKEHTKTIVVGHQLDEDTQMGPLISKSQMTTVCNYLDRAASDGARTVVGGNPHTDHDGIFLEPTVLTDVNDDDAIVREEVFGPVLVVLPFDELDEVARRANDSEYGLAAGIWTRDIAKANRLSNLLRVGSVYINTYGQSDAAAPFGGFKKSGYGRDMGRQNLEYFLETRTVWTDLRL